VYFDFGEAADAPPLISALWRLHPGSTGMALLSPIVRGKFVTAHLQGEDIEAMFTHIIQRDAAHYRQVDLFALQYADPVF
jgi:hypothetical protein